MESCPDLKKFFSSDHQLLLPNGDRGSFRRLVPEYYIKRVLHEESEIRSAETETLGWFLREGLISVFYFIPRVELSNGQKTLGIRFVVIGLLEHDPLGPVLKVKELRCRLGSSRKLTEPSC